MNRRPSRLRTFLLRHWQVVSAFSTLLVGTGIALTWRLGSLLPGYSASEQQAYAHSTSLANIWNNPLDAPFHILVKLCSFVVPDNLIATRLASVAIAWLFLVIFFVLLYKWYGSRTAWIGTAIFGSSSWFLHTGRLGTPQVMFLGILGLVACGVWLRKRKASLAIIMGMLLTAVLLYTPGMVWFVAIGLLWQWRHVDSAFKHSLGAVSAGALLLLGSIAPLALHLYKHPDAITTWLGLADTWNQPLHILQNIFDVPLAVFFRGQSNPELWLGRMPLLSVFSLVAFALGVYVFCKHYQLARVKLFITLGSIGTLAIALMDGIVPMLALAPFVYIVVAVGANYLIEVWLSVFPRNPIARSVGIGLFGMVIGLTCLYNLRNYFIAWPQANATRQVFTITKP